ncbi:hypothetical protein FSB73_20330 [Arachidicoccus ginsenosidivorans]|uniref:Uncharacterized protein n=1 Tax=Arachidicoccus ginsenosidivorans TaxID=496057 RepID=A0A5B8VPV9_9BACT|nr:hypothetical protein [Arachidicoccus ginsenosidivorans]QEC73664.1 hypothetical protein FSB73_20330 [Arachidicoccus ginsenosidivorans]
MIAYDLPNPKQPALSQWLASNPHRFNLGRIGLILKKRDGSIAKISDLGSPSQQLNLWEGISESHFTIDDETVKVTTICDGQKDILGFKIQSALIPLNRLSLFIEFPYASLGYFSNGSDYTTPKSHQTLMSAITKNSVIFDRRLDSTTYQVGCAWTGNGTIEKKAAHRYIMHPAVSNGMTNTVEYIFDFSPSKINEPLPSFAAVKTSSIKHWADFWQSGVP